jgi:uncharacterized membrane protein (DUF4010 family)
MDLDLFLTFIEALALGLLIGSERYKDKKTGEAQPAGMRTFSIISVLGASVSLLEIPWFAVLTFLSIVTFLAIGYYKDQSGSFGITTELSAFLTFWLGYMLKDYEILAISVGIILVIILASKEAMHNFVKRQVTEDEFFDTLKFLAIIFVVYPLLPNQYIGPWNFLNPTKIWTLIIFISSISYAGYILIRIYGRGRGIAISSMLGAIVSTTAVTLSLAERTKNDVALSRLCGITGVVAHAVQGPRLLLLIWFVNDQLGRLLLVPILIMAAAGLVIGGAAALLNNRRQETEPLRPALKNPFSLLPVLKFGLFFVGVFFISKMAGVWFGTEGLLAISFISGMGSVSAISLSIADMVNQGSVTIENAALAFALALVSNSLTKWLIAILNGTRLFAIWLGLGLLTILGTGISLILWQVIDKV